MSTTNNTHKMKVQANTLDKAIANATGLDCFSAELFVVANKVDDKFSTAPESVFIGTGGRYFDKKVSFQFKDTSYVAEVIVKITDETAESRSTCTEGYNIYKIA